MTLTKPHAFALLASIAILFVASSSAPTPLYALYQARWGFSPVATTVVFGAYALAVLVSLLVTGKLSDHLGRRPVLLAALAVQVATMALFAGAGNVETLVAARVLQGLATGAALAAAGAGLLDLEAGRGAIANAVGPMLGTALGGLLAGLLVQFLPAPTVLVYALLGLGFALQGAGVALMGETVAPRAGAWASLRPRLAVPAAARRPLAIAAPAVVAAWALAGFYGSLGPAVARQLTGSHALALGGMPLFVMAGSAAIAVFALRTRAPKTVLALGTGALVVGVATTLLALPHGSIPGFFIGAAIAGAGFGGSFQGAIRTVVPQAAAHERAGLLSVVFVLAYLSMGLPAVLAGLRVVHGGGVYGTAFEFGVATMALAALALFGTLLSRDAAPASRPAGALAR